MFFKFLRISFVIYVIFAVLRIIFRVGFHIHRIRRDFNNFTNQQSQGQQPRQSEKVYGKTDGEYVEFEEITSEEATSTTVETDSNDRTETAYTRTESRISDAEYEEIK